MSNIYSYAIMAEKSYKPGEFYFMFGFRTLTTLRKRFNKIKEYISKYSNRKHEHIILCARDYEGNIIKIYEEIPEV